ncbi:MAG: class I SAM-dependent methyltransferase [Flavobacteriaceae bacterium]
MNSNKPTHVADRFLTQENFELVWEENYHWAQTILPPNIHLNDYYKSEAYISHQNKSGSLFAWLYSAIQHKMFTYKWKRISLFLQGQSRVLDYGCGTADFLNHVQQHGHEVWGIEPNEVARNNAALQNNIFSSLGKLPDRLSFDCISLWHVLEHVDDPAQLLQQLKNRMAKNAILVVALPNHDSWDAQHYKEYWAAWDVPRHLWHFSKKGFMEWAKSQGWICSASYPLWFDALYVSLLSEKYQKNTLPWFGALLKGLYSNFRALKRQNYSSHFFILRPAPADEVSASA